MVDVEGGYQSIIHSCCVCSLDLWHVDQSRTPFSNEQLIQCWSETTSGAQQLQQLREMPPGQLLFWSESIANARACVFFVAISQTERTFKLRLSSNADFILIYIYIRRVRRE